ncbi:hypothetical protein Q5752_003621 [Cryptotrichosporon argae]
MRALLCLLGPALALASAASALASPDTTTAQPLCLGLRGRERLARADTVTVAGTAPASVSSTTASTATASVSLPLPPTATLTAAPAPTPTPLDTSLSYALTDACLVFLADVVSNTTFLSCLPLSLLLTTSTSFATLVDAAVSSGNYTALDLLVAYTNEPAPGAAACDAHMQAWAAELADKANCKADLASAAGGAAREAQTGLGNYEVMRQAGALTDPDTGVFCYLEAEASDGPDDLYLWHLASGTALPSTSTPTCSACSRLLLNHLAYSAANTITLNATIINDAVSAIDGACGASFVSYATEPAASSGGARVRGTTAGLALSLLGAVWLAW